MKIYALVYTYKIKKEDSKDNSHHTTMTQLVHAVGESLEDVMFPAEKEIKESKGYIDWSIKLDLKSIMPLDDVLDDIKVKLPELVQSAKEREKFTKVAEVLNDYDKNQS